jgi:hypothetical protein
MQINKSVMFTQQLSQDELYILRTMIWQLYRARIYSQGAVETTIADLVCEFEADRDFQMHLRYKGESVFSFDPKSKIIRIDWEKFDEIYSSSKRNGQTLGWSIGAILDQIYQEQAGSAQYVFETMITTDTRKIARDFYGLLEATAGLSTKRMYNHVKFSLVRRSDGIAVYDDHGFMVIHATPKFVHFGVGYITGTNINENVKSVVEKLRPHVLGIREAFKQVRSDLAKLMTDALKTRDQLLKLAAGTLTQAARFDVNRFRKEYVHVAASGTKVFVYDDRLVLEAARGGRTIGTIELFPGQRYPDMAAPMLDALRENFEWMKAIQSDITNAMGTYGKYLHDQVVEFFEEAAVMKMGIPREHVGAYLASFQSIKDRGFRGDFEEFVAITKPLKD